MLSEKRHKWGLYGSSPGECIEALHFTIITYHPSEMRSAIDALPDEIFVMCIAFAIDGQPAGPLECTMVSKRWERLLLRTPSLWSQIYVQNGEDEQTRISTFLHLSQKHSLHVDIVTVLPNMDNLQLIAKDISRVAIISIRPGPSETITYVYMEQWKRSASYILATLYKNLCPSQVLSVGNHSQCTGLSVRKNDQCFDWVFLMQLTMRASREHNPVYPVSVKSSDDWTYFRVWEEHITRTMGGYTNQVTRTSSINPIAGFTSYAKCCDAIRIAIPAFVMLLKDDSFSVQAVAMEALDIFAAHVELRGALRLALVERFGHANTQIRNSVIPAFVRLAKDSELGGCMTLPPPLLLELFDDPDVDIQMSTVSRLMKVAEYVKSNESLRATIPSLVERLKDVNAGTGKSAISILKALAGHSDFDELLRVAIRPLIELVRHTNPSVQIASLALLRSLDGYPEFGEALSASILSLIERLGDKDAGIRTTTISVIKRWANYKELGVALKFAIPSLIERIGDVDPGIRTSVVSVIQSFAEYKECFAAFRVAIPLVIEQLGDPDPSIRTSALSVVQNLAKYDDFDAALKFAIPPLIERLGDTDPGIRTSAILVVQNLAEYDKFEAALRVVIPSVINLLEDGPPCVRSSASFILDKLGHRIEHAGDASGKDDEASDLEVDVFHGASAGLCKRGTREDSQGQRVNDFIADLHPSKRRRTAHKEAHVNAESSWPQHRTFPKLLPRPSKVRDEARRSDIEEKRNAEGGSYVQLSMGRGILRFDK